MKTCRDCKRFLGNVPIREKTRLWGEFETMLFQCDRRDIPRDEYNAREKRVMSMSGDGILRLYGDGDEVFAACERFVEKTESTKQTDLFRF
mgnify:CR=1 FL=1